MTSSIARASRSRRRHPSLARRTAGARCCSSGCAAGARSSRSTADATGDRRHDHGRAPGPDQTMHVSRTVVRADARLPRADARPARAALLRARAARADGAADRRPPVAQAGSLRGARPGGDEAYPFYEVDGKEVHEVAVGPIHAGVIEPGSFRFMCLGEQVIHLEIQLGYQHRGVENAAAASAILARSRRSSRRSPATPASRTRGPTARRSKALAGCDARPRDRGWPAPSRSSWSGSRCTSPASRASRRTWASSRARRPTVGSARRRSTRRCGSAAAASVAAALSSPAARPAADLGVELGGVDRGELAAASRRRRHHQRLLPRVTNRAASPPGRRRLDRERRPEPRARRARGARLGRGAAISGPRSSGAPTTWYPLAAVSCDDGDCWARARVRIREIDASLAWLDRGQRDLPGVGSRPARVVGAWRPTQLVDRDGRGLARRGRALPRDRTTTAALVHYKVQDPSLRNWMGLALAVRGNEISGLSHLQQELRSLLLRERSLTCSMRSACAPPKGRSTSPTSARPVPAGFRGLPVIARRRRARRLARAASTRARRGAIALDPRHASISGGACSATECVEACPEAKIALHAGAAGWAPASASGLVVRRGRPDPHAGPSVRGVLEACSGARCKLRQVSAGGCNGCELELNAVANVNFDLQRFGIEWVASPRHADALVLTGPLTRTWETRCGSPGTRCPSRDSSSPWAPARSRADSTRARAGVDRSFSSEVGPALYVPGCPPHPLTFVNAILDLLGVP